MIESSKSLTNVNGVCYALLHDTRVPLLTLTRVATRLKSGRTIYYICNEPRGGGGNHDLSHTKNEQTRSVDGII